MEAKELHYYCNQYYEYLLKEYKNPYICPQWNMTPLILQKLKLNQVTECTQYDTKLRHYLVPSSSLALSNIRSCFDTKKSSRLSRNWWSVTLFLDKDHNRQLIASHFKT